MQWNNEEVLLQGSTIVSLTLYLLVPVVQVHKKGGCRDGGKETRQGWIIHMVQYDR